MTGRGLVEKEEKRQYGVVYLFVVGILLACSVWAIWQDSFSRHLWKHYKTDFYRAAIAKYDQELVDEAARLAEVPEYVALTEKLAAAEESVSSGEGRRRIDELEAQLVDLEVEQLEADLSLRIVKGEIEEAWYWYEHALQGGHSTTEEKARLEELQGRRGSYEQRFEDAKVAVAAANAEIDSIRASVTSIEEELRPYHKEREALELRLDSVSFELFGGRVPHVPVIEQTVLKHYERNNFENWVDRVDRCQNCHVAIDRAGFEDFENPHKTHPDRAYYLGNHEVRKFGCTPCHGGQGPSINSLDLAHGNVKFWEDPLLDTDDRVQGKCLNCHNSVQGLEGAEIAARGEWLFQEMGCHGCHLMSGMESLPKSGPSLERIAAKTPPEWLVSWIEDPRSFRPRTRMPHFFLERDEAESIAGYLIDASLDRSVAWLEEHPEPDGINSGDPKLVETGRELTRSLGCLGCHGFEADEFASQVADEKDTAPNLSRIAEKTSGRWIYHWIRDPRAYSEHARMPSLRLAEDEAAAITSYLLTLRQQETADADADLRERLAAGGSSDDGTRLIRKYGCFGCHVIPGMEAESRISVELSGFANKHLEEMYFGNRLDIPKSWEDWTVNKVLTPRTYETERIEQVMPQFGFSEEDAWAITVFLGGMSDHPVSPAYVPDPARPELLRAGRQLVARYNCQGCHSFDGRDGAIRRFYEDDIEDAPPILMGEGSKLQGEWFFDFLMKPVRLRPWLDVRMPSFGLTPEESTTIVDYFAALEGLDLGPVVVAGADSAGPEIPPVHVPLPDGVYDCYACHVETPKGPAEGQYAVSTEGLPRDAMSAWVAEHLGIEDDASADTADKSAVIREYLGAGGQ